MDCSRASALYRIARFPIPRSEKQREAWSLNNETFLAGAALLPHPITQVDIPHTHGLAHEGKAVQTYSLFPSHASATKLVPIVLVISGLDGYRTDNCTFAEAFYNQGLGMVVFDIPGTADSPADPTDPRSPDRVASSVLDWCDAQDYIDSARVCVWGLSTGGFYAVRIAHTHRERLIGVVAQGLGAHYLFDREWLGEVDHLEYPYE